MYAKYHDKGLNIVGVNTMDSQDEIQKFRKEFKLTMPLVTNDNEGKSVGKQYGVVAAPTNYVIDKDGVVKASFVGYNEAALKKALKELGIEL